MNWLQKLFKRQAPVAAKRTFNAAAVNRLTNDWSTGTLSADSQLRWTHDTLRARSRQLADNNEFAAKFLSMLENNVLGEKGMGLKSTAKDPDTVKGGQIVPGRMDVFANKIIEEEFWRWGKRQHCTVTRMHSWRDAQKLALRAVAVDGEVIVRKVRGYSNDYKFAIQLMEGDHLDTDKNEQVPGGGQIRMGVEIDAFGATTFYHIKTRNPNDYGFYGEPETTLRVPAADIIYVSLPRRIGQTRGLPWMAPAMLNVKMLGGYREAELVRARVSASKMAVLTSPAGDGYTGGPNDNGVTMDAEPGAIEQLPPGMDIKPIDWNSPNTAFPDFNKACLRGIAAALGCSYNILADDMESVNFSSGRLGLEEPRETYKALQNWFAESFCQPIFEEWLMMQLLTGKIGLPIAKFTKFAEPTWQGRRWGYIQPKEDAEAAILRIKNGLSTVTRELMVQGLDRDEVFDQLAEDKAAADSRDLDLPDIFPDVESPDNLKDNDDTEDSPDMKDNKAAGKNAAAASGVVQDTALNGAQVTALMELAQSVASGAIPLETAKGVANAAFPLITDEELNAIFNPLKSFKPKIPVDNSTAV